MEATRSAKEGDVKKSVVEIAMEETRKTFLPPYDEETTQHERAYDVKNMSGEDAWDQMSKVITAVSHKDDWRTSLCNERNAFPESIRSVLSGFDDNLSKNKEDARKTKIMLFLRHMLSFNENARLLGGKKTAEEFSEMTNIPDVVVVQLLKVFATKKERGYGFSKTLEDKRKLWILLLFVLGAGGKKCKCGDMSALLGEMSLDVKTASELLKQAGVTVKKGKDSVSAELKVPLVFPGPKRGGGKK